MVLAFSVDIQRSNMLLRPREDGSSPANSVLPGRVEGVDVVELQDTDWSRPGLSVTRNPPPKDPVVCSALGGAVVRPFQNAANIKEAKEWAYRLNLGTGK